MRKHILYKATNLINGKYYIGITWSLRKRFNNHFSDAKTNRLGSGSVFHRAIRKYGRDMIHVTVLSVFPSEESAAIEERRLIALWNPDYNVGSGGEGLLGSRQTERWRKSVVEANSKSVQCLDDGNFFSSATEANRYYGTKGVSRVCNGRGVAAGRHFIYCDVPHDANARVRLIGERNAARNNKIRNGRKSGMKPVQCIDDLLWHESIEAAARFYDIPATHIGGCAQKRKRHISAAGLHFTHEIGLCNETNHMDIVAEIEKRRQTAYDHIKHSVICLNDGMIYDSATSAGAAYGIGRCGVRGAIKRGNTTRNGYRFAFVEKK